MHTHVYMIDRGSFHFKHPIPPPLWGEGVDRLHFVLPCRRASRRTRMARKLARRLRRRLLGLRPKRGGSRKGRDQKERQTSMLGHDGR